MTDFHCRHDTITSVAATNAATSVKTVSGGIGPGQVIRRRSDGSLEFLRDELTIEEPLEIRVGRKIVATTMRTPGHDEELAAGFLLSEGIVRDPDTIIGFLRPAESGHGNNIISATLRPGAKIKLSAAKRIGTITSSCGICGKNSIAAIRQNFAPIKATKLRLQIETLLQLPGRLRDEQPEFARTGGIHAAGIFDFDGTSRVVREDIGRHNAVDKVIGRAFLEKRLPLSEHVLMVSGRASFEIMQKALAAGIPVIASVSAPSTMAMNFARECGQTLVGFLRPPAFNIYSHAECIVLGDSP